MRLPWAPMPDSAERVLVAPSVDWLRRMCPSCGRGISIDTRYCGAGIPRRACQRNPHHLHNACQACHYEWLEAAPDNLPPTVTGKEG